MKRAMRAVLAAAALALALACGGGNSTLGGPCSATCDCKRTDAPVRCPGEWLCNAQKTCEYTCAKECSGPVSTCPSDTPDCNGSICSGRKACTQ